MVTQQEAVNWLNSQVGQHLDYDHKYGQQCVDGMNYYYQYVTGDNPYGDGYGVNYAKDLWNVPNNRLTKIPDSTTLTPQPGDIAVYGSGWGNGDGHVEMVLITAADGCWFVGENEHNNVNEGTVKVFRTWAQMRGLIGVMRFNWVSPPSAPSYVPINIGRYLNLPKAATMWHVYRPGGPYNIPHAVGTLNPAKYASANGYLSYQIQANPQTDFYTITTQSYGQVVIYGAPSTGATITDSIPAMPVAAAYVPPAAPIPFPAAETYTLVTALPTYATATAAMSSINQVNTAAAGNYYVTSKDNKAYNLSTINGTDQSQWVNTLDNKVPKVVVAPAIVETAKVEKPATITLEAKPVETTGDIMASFRWFYPTHEPVEYTILKPYVVRDQVHTSQPINIFPGTDKNGDPKTIEIYGTFVREGNTYLRPLTGMDSNGLYSMYGIPTTDMYSGAPYLQQEFNVGDKVYYGADLYIDKAVKSLEGVWRWQKNIRRKIKERI